jgi:hypothetical protein
MTTRTQAAYAAAGVVLLLGLSSLFNPVLTARLLGFEINAPRAFSEVRATYGALHVTMAALLLWAIPLRPRLGVVVRTLGGLWAGAAVGRLASLLIDANWTVSGFVLLLAQVVVAGVLVWASLEVPPPPAEIRARREIAAARERAKRAQGAPAVERRSAPRTTPVAPETVAGERQPDRS